MKRILALFSGILLLSLLLRPSQACAQVETAERYLAESWQKSPVAPILVPYQVEPEPFNQVGSLQVPIPWKQMYLMVIQALDAKQRPVTYIQAALKAAGDYLSPMKAVYRSDLLPDICFAPASKDPVSGNIAYTAQLSKQHTGIRIQTNDQQLSDFPYNDPKYSITAPHYSPDGRVLYFASNQPGGQGGYDIWMSNLDGMTWTPPRTVPGGINTPGDELNPTLMPDGSLCFARKAVGDSDFDLYQTHTGGVTLLPYPVNTRFDDLSVTAAPGGRLWVSSTRPTYAGTAPGPQQLFRLTPKPALNATVRHQRSGRHLAGVDVVVEGKNGRATATSQADGSFPLLLEPTEQYQLLVATAAYDTLRIKAVNLAQGKLELPLVDKEYWDLQLKFTEYGKVPKTPIVYALYENGRRIDSLTYDTARADYRILRPGSAYLIRAFSGDYPPKEQTFNTPPANPTDSVKIAAYIRDYGRLPRPIKDPHTVKMDFGWPIGAYTRIHVQNTARAPIADVQIKAYQGRERLDALKVPRSDAAGQSWIRFEKNARYVLVGSADGLIGYTELDTQSERPGNDTLSATLLLSKPSAGEAFLLVPRPADPILLQAGKVDEMIVLLALLDADPEMRVELSGHADPSEGPAATQNAKDAAEFAADFLFLNGIARDRVRVLGYGATRPRFTGSSAVAQAGNKRLEVRRL
jgi:hypothetical protein